MPEAIALFSSSRRNGNTGRLIDRIALELDIEVVDLANLRIAPYDYDHRNRHDDFELLMERVLPFGHLIFATPIYWYAASPAMKIFLDRISDLLELPDLLPKGRQLRGKSAYLVCTSACDEPAVAFTEAFRETFAYLGMNHGGLVHVNCGTGYDAARHDALALQFTERLSRAIRP